MGAPTRASLAGNGEKHGPHRLRNDEMAYLAYPIAIMILTFGSVLQFV